MFKLKIIKLANMLIEKGISKKEDKEIIVYGLTSGIEIIFNIITTIVLGVFWGLIVESLVFLISFSMIRVYAGGYHCKKAINCYLFSSLIVILVLGIVKFIPEGDTIVFSMIMLLISLPIILKLAPMETPTKPLDKEEQKYFRKKMVQNLNVQCAVMLVLFLSELDRYVLVVGLGIAMSAGLVVLQQIQIKRKKRDYDYEI